MTKTKGTQNRYEKKIDTKIVGVEIFVENPSKIRQNILFVQLYIETYSR